VVCLHCGDPVVDEVVVCSGSPGGFALAGASRAGGVDDVGVIKEADAAAATVSTSCTQTEGFEAEGGGLGGGPASNSAGILQSYRCMNDLECDGNFTWVIAKERGIMSMRRKREGQ
jgi:hypothetical protein